ncbi:MAG: lysophospholipid acyltransferase family protein [Actinomycetota bacterium]
MELHGDTPSATTDHGPEAHDTGEIGRWYWTVRRMTVPLHGGWLKVDVGGLENVPSDGGVILAANHLSFLDSVLLMYAPPRRVTFLGKQEYVTARATRRLFPAAGMIPVDRSGRGVARSLGLAIERLRAGEIVGIFPEGTRSRDGLLHPGHPGVAHMALKSGAPIVPVGIVGSDRSMAPGRLLPNRSPISVTFGEPIDLGPWAGRPCNKTTKAEITEEVMACIANISGQERVTATSPSAAPVPVGVDLPRAG